MAGDIHQKFTDLKIPLEDLEHVAEQCQPQLELLRGRHIFITGGTGFFGKWLLESLLFLNQKENLNLRIGAISRNPAKFFETMPHLQEHKHLKFIQGDLEGLRSVRLTENIDYLIHAATEASAALNANEPVTMARTAGLATDSVLQFAVAHKVSRLLFTSSGAIYGKQPPEVTHIRESFAGAPGCRDVGAAYAEGKRYSEMLCACYEKQYGLKCVIARCFAFVGPHLPLDAHFAIGNFIRDAISTGPIIVNGDGTPYRSYLYSSDLVIWLLTLLLRGNCGRAYNVGSPEAYTIKEIAELVASAAGPGRVISVQSPITGKVPTRYVPDVSLAREELGLQSTVTLAKAIEKTIHWVRQGNITSL